MGGISQISWGKARGTEQGRRSVISHSTPPTSHSDISINQEGAKVETAVSGSEGSQERLTSFQLHPHFPNKVSITFRGHLPLPSNCNSLGRGALGRASRLPTFPHLLHSPPLVLNKRCWTARLGRVRQGGVGCWNFQRVCFQGWEKVLRVRKTCPPSPLPSLVPLSPGRALGVLSRILLWPPLSGKKVLRLFGALSLPQSEDTVCVCMCMCVWRGALCIRKPEKNLTSNPKKKHME